MKIYLFILVAFCSTKSFAQEDYNWNQLTGITLIDTILPNTETDKELITFLDSVSNRAKCNIKKWKVAFSKLPYGPVNDIIKEKTYILLCEFNTKDKIPFMFFPKQKAILDLRKHHSNFESFPERYKLIDIIFKKCLTDLKKQQ